MRERLPSPAQESIWVAEQDCPRTPAFNLHSALRLRGRVDAGALDRAFREIVRRHEALRTRVIGHDSGRPVAVRDDCASFAMTVVEPAVEDAIGREEVCARIAREEARTAFDLTSSLPIRATLVRLADDDHILLLTLHHTSADGWSLGIIARELSARCSADAARARAALPVAGAYGHYADRQLAANPRWDQELRHWIGTLTGWTAMELPSDRPRPATRDLVGEATFFSLSPELANGLRRLSRRAKCSLFMTLAAALTILIARRAATDDVLIGTKLASRPQPFQDAIGLFVNHVALRTMVSGEPSIFDVLGRVRDTTLAAHRNANVPFERVLDALPELASDMYRRPLFPVMVQLLKFGRAPLDIEGARVSAFGPVGGPDGTADLLGACIQTGTTGTSKFDLSFDLLERGDEIWGRVEFSTQLFDRPTIDQLTADFERVLQVMVERPSSRLSALHVAGVDGR
jgi:hypothetical protein